MWRVRIMASLFTVSGKPNPDIFHLLLKKREGQALNETCVTKGDLAMSQSKLAILEVVVAVMEDEIDALTERLNHIEQVLRDNDIAYIDIEYFKINIDE